VADPVVPNPWLTEAQDVIGDDSIIGDRSIAKAAQSVARALAKAYEYGFAQGRLAEVDLARCSAAEALAIIDNEDPDAP